MSAIGNRAIPFFPYPQLFTAHEAELLAVMADVCRRGAYIQQQDCRDFEASLAAFMGVKHAFGVANGTDALIIGLKAAGIGPGDEVILPSHTYIATAAAVHMVGATPVLAECGPDHMLDAADAERRITPRTKAIMPVQVNGRTCDMDAIEAVAKRHQLLICEDAAQGLGSKFRGRSAGSFGVFGTISFYPAKLLGCFGDGGAIVTNDDDIARQIGLLRDHGRNDDGRVVAWGYNSRLDNLQAAVLNFKFKSFPRDIARRRAIAAMYQEGLGSLAELSLPPAPDADVRHYDVYQNYELEADRRDELKTYLEARGVRTIIQWAGTPVHQFKELGFAVELPKTDAFFRRCLMLPMNVALSDDDVHYVVAAVRDFYGR
ncbi:MAG TPA: DegT/DnrJ/EryC1/StrS family aminotransferase [Vicinamibacterales bacterium]|nr:DegT/DnrJ/EryC1/StrS family aminotransferase [Vicinamibacterales bacterium]